MAQRDLLLPWSTALDNAALPLLVRGVARARARAQARPLFAQFGLEGFEALAPTAVGRNAPARGVPSHPARRQEGAALDEPFASLDAITRGEMQGWLTGALAAEPRTVSAR